MRIIWKCPTISMSRIWLWGWQCWFDGLLLGSRLKCQILDGLPWHLVKTFTDTDHHEFNCSQTMDCHDIWYNYQQLLNNFGWSHDSPCGTLPCEVAGCVRSHNHVIWLSWACLVTLGAIVLVRAAVAVLYPGGCVQSLFNFQLCSSQGAKASWAAAPLPVMTPASIWGPDPGKLRNHWLHS